MKIKIIKLNAVCMQLPFRRSSDFVVETKFKINLSCEVGSFKEVAHLNKKGSLQKKPRGVF